MSERPAPPAEAFNAFAALGLEPRLSLDEAQAESRWRELGRSLHPDAEAGSADHAASINRAWQILRSPARRLRHWLALRGIDAGRQTAVDPAMMDLFTEAGALFARAEDLLRRRDAAASALAKALLAETEFTLQRQLQDFLARLQAERLAVTSRFAGFDEAARAGAECGEAVAAAGRLAFLEKWESRCQDLILRFISGG